MYLQLYTFLSFILYSTNKQTKYVDFVVCFYFKFRFGPFLFRTYFLFSTLDKNNNNKTKLLACLLAYLICILVPHRYVHI